MDGLAAQENLNKDLNSLEKATRSVKGEKYMKTSPRVRWMILTVFAVSFAFSSLNVVAAQYQPPHNKPGPASDRIIYSSIAQDLAPAAIQAGDIDFYMYNLRAAAAKELVGLPGISLLTAPSGTAAFCMNPAPRKDGKLNPFENRKIRFAMNYIIDRDYIANEVYGGLAVPMVTHLASTDPDYAVIFDIVAAANPRLDLDYARQLIKPEMEAMGAELVDDKWMYNGEPVTIKFIIRVEDERRDWGDTIASLLEEIGFTVDRAYSEFGPAIDAVYGTDPLDHEWDAYTEGFGKSGLDLYDITTINQMHCPWYGWMPGYQEAGWWNYENATLDMVGQQLFRSEFGSLAERHQLYRYATEMAVQEAVRLWVVTQFDSTPFSDDLQGLTRDLGSGARSSLGLRNAYVPGRTEIKVGDLWVWTERSVWNPVGGFDDVYSLDIARAGAVFDRVDFTHPFTGLRVPQRVTWEVETAGPFGTLDIEEGTYTWSAEQAKWVEVSGTAKTKVKFDFSLFFQSKWHHGQPITMADLFYSIYQDKDLTYNPVKNTIESSTAARRQATWPTFKGFKILSDTEIEVYVDYWFPDDSYIADYAVPFADLSQTGMTPWSWEVMAAQDEVVFTDKALMYSDTAAETFGVSWMDCVVDADARLIYNKLKDLKAANFFPANVFTVGDRVLATPAEAQARYSAAIKWFEDHGHMVIGNGPFVLTSFDAAAQFAQLDAFRDPTYPFKPGDFYYGWPEEVDIVDVSVKPVTTGQATVFTVELLGPGTLSARYLVQDPETGEVLRVGDAVEVTPGTFEIRLPRDFTYLLEPGSYDLVVAGISDETAFVSARREVFEAAAPPSGVVTVTATQTQTVGAATVTTTQTVGAATVTTTETETVTQPDYLWVGAAAIVALIIGIVGGWVAKRK